MNVVIQPYAVETKWLGHSNLPCHPRHRVTQLFSSPVCVGALKVHTDVQQKRSIEAPGLLQPSCFLLAVGVILLL